MDENKKLQMTSFKLTVAMHDKLKMMCVLTHVSMGEFIRVAISEKIKQLKGEK